MKIGSTTGLAAGSSVSYTDKITHEFIAIKVNFQAAITGGAALAANVTEALKNIKIQTKLTGVIQTLIQNVDLYTLGVMSQDFHGLFRAQIKWSDGTGLSAVVPVIQSDGRIDADWQIDITNNTGEIIDVEVCGMSAGKSKSNLVMKYLPASMGNDLNRRVKPSQWNKILVNYEFSTIDAVINGSMEQITPQDASDFSNLNDEICFIYEGTDTDQRVVGVPSDTGYAIFDNNSTTKFDDFVIHRDQTNVNPVYYWVVNAVAIGSTDGEDA